MKCTDCGTSIGRMPQTAISIPDLPERLQGSVRRFPDTCRNGARAAIRNRRPVSGRMTAATGLASRRKPDVLYWIKQTAGTSHRRVRVMKKIICAALLFASVPAFAGELSDKDAQNLIEIVQEIRSYCRDYNPDNGRYIYPCLCGMKLEGDEWVDTHKPTANDYLVKILHQNGWCHGKKGQAEYQKTWHKCTNDSER